MEIRKKIVLERGIPVLLQNGFEKSPFKSADFGWHPGLGYFYELSRVTKDSHLQMINIEIIKGDRWIQIWLDVFELTPILKSLSELEGIDNLQFKLPPANSNRSRMHVDDMRGIPLLNREFMGSLHKLKKRFTHRGHNHAATILGAKVEKDLANINDFFKKWYQLHKPHRTTWEGKME